MAEYAYSTDNPEALAAFHAAIQARSEFARRLIASAEAIGKNKGPIRLTHPLLMDRFVGLVPDDPSDPPAGWRYLKSRDRFEPRHGKAGADARAWLVGNQPPEEADGRGALERLGLPRTSHIGDRDAMTYRIGSPHIFEHVGTLWASYDGEPAGECTWTPRRLSEYHAAKEAHEAAITERQEV